MSRRIEVRRRGIALLLTLLLVTLLLAISSQLATRSACYAVITARRCATLQHHRAVDSAVELVGALLREHDRLPDQLKRDGQAAGHFKIGDCEVDMLVRDDGGKFNLPHTNEDTDTDGLQRKLDDLAHLKDLPAVQLVTRPVTTEPKQDTQAAREPTPNSDENKPEQAYVTLDQFFGATAVPALYHWDPPEPDRRSKPVWSDYVTVFGDGCIDLKTADRQIVDLTLGEGLPGALANVGSDGELRDALQHADNSIRKRFAARVGYGLNRYALTVHTALGSDVRRWYVVVSFKDGRISVHHRQQITW